MPKRTSYENLTKIQEACLNRIDTLGIYELRALARVFGDTSPTTSKRDDHIHIIMDKIISGEDLKPIPLRQGRPYKELCNIDGILQELSQITGKDYTFKNNSVKATKSPAKTVTFKQVEEEIVARHLDPIEVCGIIFEKNENELFLFNDKTGDPILVKRESHPKIDVYDYITGSAVIMNTDKQYILNKIDTINFKPISQYSTDFANDDIIVPNKMINLNSSELLLGTRYLVNHAKFVDFANDLKNNVKILQNEGVKCIALVPNVFAEDRALINSIGFDNTFLISYDESIQRFAETINIFINHIKRLQEIGVRTAIFVQDIVTIANSIDINYKLNPKEILNHTEEATQSIKEIVTLAKACKTFETTLFITYDKIDNDDPLYMTYVYKVCKNSNL